MNLRLLSPADIPAARRLWHICFPEDSEAFLDWFFVSGRVPELSVGCFGEGRLLSVMHGSVMPLTCGNKIMPALMVSGVATEPEERGKGLMHRTMLFLKEKAEERNIHVLFNHPKDPNAYKRLGYRPCTDTLYFDQPRAFFKDTEDATLQSVPFSETGALHIYTEAAGRYNAFSVRDAHAFSRRVWELIPDGAEAFLFTRNGLPAAYCFCRREGDLAVLDEILSLTEYAPVLSAVCRMSGCTRVQAKLPPDVELPGERRVQNIMLADDAVYAAFGYGRTLCYSVDEY